MTELSTTALHAGADAAAAQGDFMTALANAAEALRVVPSDHRARLKVGLCLAMLNRQDAALRTIQVVANTLFRRGFVLAAIGACRDAFAVVPGAAPIKETLATIHGRIHRLEQRGRSRVPPPGAITEVPAQAQESIFKLPSADAALAAAVQLGTTDPDPSPDVRADIVAVPFFSDLSKDAFISLVERLSYHKLLPGQEIVKEGAAGSSLFIVVQGELKVTRGEGDARVELAKLGAGTLFGELSLLTQKPRAATVSTTQASELFEIDRKAVEEVAATSPTLTEEIVGFARRRLLLNLLQTSRIFQPFDEAQRLEILRAFQSKVVAPGTVVITEGQEPSGLYVVLEGEVEVAKTDPSGDRVVLAYLKEGEVFGEIGLLNKQPATANVVSAEKSVLLWLERSKFEALTKDHPKVLEYLSSLSGERLAELKQAMSSEGVILEGDDLIIL